MVCFLSSAEDSLSDVYEYFNKVRKTKRRFMTLMHFTYWSIAYLNYTTEWHFDNVELYHRPYGRKLENPDDYFVKKSRPNLKHELWITYSTHTSASQLNSHIVTAVILSVELSLKSTVWIRLNPPQKNKPLCLISASSCRTVFNARHVCFVFHAEPPFEVTWSGPRLPAASLVL